MFLFCKVGSWTALYIFKYKESWFEHENMTTCRNTSHLLNKLNPQGQMRFHYLTSRYTCKPFVIFISIYIFFISKLSPLLCAAVTLDSHQLCSFNITIICCLIQVADSQTLTIFCSQTGTFTWLLNLVISLFSPPFVTNAIWVKI